jgi:prepilin-type N-terminal cleavage/methylation domain-containing protein
MSSGMTLIEVLIVVVILAAVGGGIALGCNALLGQADPEKTKAQARQFANDLGYNVVGVTCLTHDSDGDGYVSCTIRYREGAEADAPTQTLAIECAGGVGGWYKEGCRQPKFRTHSGR